MRILQSALLAAVMAASGPVFGEDAPPPAAPAPAAVPGGQGLETELASLRRDVQTARRELDEANAAVARASRGSSAAQLERLVDRQQRAERTLATVRERVPALLAAARAAGLSDAAVRSYQRSLSGE